MNTRKDPGKNMLDVIPDILLWIDNKGHLMDFHPNNHAFLFDREGGVLGCHLEEIFNRELSTQVLDLAKKSRENNQMQLGQVTYQENGSASHFECRISPVNDNQFIAGWREINHMAESRKGELIKGNNQATLALLTENSQDEAINKAFKYLGESYHADRITLFKNHTDPDSSEVFMSLQNEWSHHEIALSLDNLQLSHIPYNPDFINFYDTLKSNSPVIAIADDLTESARKFLSQMEILSSVVMPVFVRSSFWGFLSVSDCRSQRSWKEEEVGAIKTISVILGAVIQKHQDQEELTIARLQSEESDRLKSSILANINHELRTPMTGILGFSEILARQLDDHKTREMAENIHLSGNRLLATLNSMIELSQFEAQKAQYKLIETRLNEMILMTCEAHIAAAKKKRLGFEIYMHESIFSYVEEKVFIKLLNHILENAVKFTDEGTIIVETKHEWSEGKSWSCISVTDTGPGIPQEFHEIIFEEFRQVSEGYNRSFEGSGLGLTLAKKIVNLMNGKITLTSQLGNGCTFTIYLPSSQLNTLEVPPTGIEPQHIQRATNVPGPEIIRPLPSILIVEDNKLNCDLIQIYLRIQCNCDTAKNGETAVDMARKKKYDIIVMDINLGPGIDGMEATRRIKKLPRHTQTPIIAVTGYTMNSDRKEILESGCTHYLPKPIDKSSLTTLITELVSKH
ncbi:MAG: response regulator [Bacteroidales bacterium]|nr:response regulator [Bacteroidota bacterium]MBL6950399.1 response regulator [Bacteroidales bacterium]